MIAPLRPLPLREGDYPLLDFRRKRSYRWLRQAGVALLMGVALLIPTVPDTAASEAHFLLTEGRDSDAKPRSVFVSEDVEIFDVSGTIELSSSRFHDVFLQRKAACIGLKHGISESELGVGIGWGITERR